MKTQPQDKATESLGGHRAGQEAQCPNRAWEAGETGQGDTGPELRSPQPEVKDRAPSLRVAP